MKVFLEFVAEDILSKFGNQLACIAIVFPNKRASLFLNDFLVHRVKKPIWSPAYTTISDLFRNHSDRQVADPIKLVCDLHKSFIQQTGIDETLDHFYSWGQVLLSDFDDIDKQLADADHLLMNLTNLHQMDDDSFLTEEQRQVLRRFFSNFSEDHNTKLKQRFLRLWSHMADVYHDFNNRLQEQNLAYEGALYREVAMKTDLEFQYDKYLFVGFNVLSQAEKKLFTTLKHQGKALFYWDYDNYYMKASEAGYFMQQNITLFPNEFDARRKEMFNNFEQPKSLCIASSSTENIQGRYVATWLQAESKRIKDGRRTAIVLGNEGLLPTIIHSLPDSVDSINITTGYPLSQSPVASLVNLLLTLRRDGFDHQQEHFRLRQVCALLRHPYLVSASNQASILLTQLTAERNYFPTPAQLAVDELTTLIFHPIGLEHKNTELLAWMANIVQTIAQRTDDKHDILKVEALFMTYTILNRLKNLSENGDLITDIITLGRLISQLLQTSSIPFHGEPVDGLQVMGVLETRNLDFDHLLILSANEGNIPKGTSDSSFIPHALRKAFGLTTTDHKVAIYSYYFHRLLQRATDITIVYNNATTDGKKGEMSRFLLQLMVNSPHPINYLTLQGIQNSSIKSPQEIKNTAQLPDMLSPTAINRFLRCPLQFHYYYICGLKEPNDTEEDIIDNRIFGNIFHEASQTIYTRLMDKSRRILTSDIDVLLKTQVDIERAVDEAFRKELFQIKGDTRRSFKPRLNGLQIINREVIIYYLRQLLTIDRQLAPFTIMGLEDLVTTQLKVNVNGKDQMVTVGGRIDRLDKVTDRYGTERIRVIDYKTGSHRLKPLADVDAIFRQESLVNHSDYYLQTMLYATIVAGQNKQIPVSPALLFIQHASGEEYDPTLFFGKEKINDVAPYADHFIQRLTEVTEQMFDHKRPLAPTPDKQRCRTCPYRLLCHSAG